MKKSKPSGTLTNPTTIQDSSRISFDQYCQANHIIKLDISSSYLATPKKSTFSFISAKAPINNYSMIIDESSVKQQHYLDGQKHITRDLYNGRYEVIAQIDLHNYNRATALDKLETFLNQYSTPSQSCLKVIHGYGHNSVDNISVLKLSVRKYLAQHNNVVAYSHARANNGGDGVTLIKLKRVK